MYTVKATDYANRLRALLADGRFAFIEGNAKKYDTFEDAQNAREYFKTVWNEKFNIYFNNTLVG